MSQVISKFLGDTEAYLEKLANKVAMVREACMNPRLRSLPRQYLRVDLDLDLDLKSRLFLALPGPTLFVANAPRTLPFPTGQGQL